MTEPPGVVKCAALRCPSFNPIELVVNRRPEVDRNRAPGGFSRISRKFGGNFFADFETARSDPCADRSPDRGMSFTRHLLFQLGDDTGNDTSPTCVSDSDCVFSLEYHSETVSREDYDGDIGAGGPERVTLACRTGSLDSVHHGSVYLPQRRPFIRDVALEAQPAVGVGIIPHIPIGSLRE